MISTIGAVAIGGALGAIARYGVNISSIHVLGNGFPWATLIVNILGSFIMGLAIAKFSTMDQISQEIKILFVTGFLGAFTTFSAFSLDFVNMWERGEIMPAMLYIMASVIASILALFFGLFIIRGLSS